MIPQGQDILRRLVEGERPIVRVVSAVVVIAAMALVTWYAARTLTLVRDRQEGRHTHYTAQLRALAPLIDWTSQMTGFWESRFDDLEDLLKRMDQ